MTIPKSVDKICNRAMYYCTGLTTINMYPNPKEITMEAEVFAYVPKNATLHVLPKYKDYYLSEAPWNEFNIVDDFTHPTRLCVIFSLSKFSKCLLDLSLANV